MQTFSPQGQASDPSQFSNSEIYVLWENITDSLLNLFHGNNNIYHMLMTTILNIQATVDGDEHDDEDEHDEGHDVDEDED